MKTSPGARAVKRIKEGIFLLFLLFMGFLIGVNFFSPDTLFKWTGRVPYVVKSNSMKPVFSKGDIVVVARVNTNQLKRDDIIAVRSRQGIQFAHFVADQYIDDNNHLRFKTRPYGPVDKDHWDYESLRRDQIMGKVNLIIPHLGHLSLFVRSPIGLRTLGLDAILIFLLIRNQEKRREIEEAQERKATKARKSA
ncbi:MAG: S24/S26 family peptidase [Tissierellia bacterium]|nr:S24/S26 family peptidase [Tissierellia bacterium]